MQTRTKYILTGAAILVAYAFGYWSAPAKIKTVEIVKEVEVDKKHKETETHQDKKTTVTDTVNPDGTKTTTTVTEDIVDKHRETDNTSIKDKDTTVTKEVTKSGKVINVSLLAGTPVNGSGDLERILGASVTATVIGPITTGVWFLSNQTVGFSVGLNF